MTDSHNKESQLKGIPTKLKHKPIIACNYRKFIGVEDDDARYLSIGHAQYNFDSVSVKLFRNTGSRWSRQSEEIPIERIADFTLFFISAIKKIFNLKDSSEILKVDTVEANNIKILQDDLQFLKNGINNADNNNKDRIRESLKEIKRILNKFDFEEILK